MLAGRRRRRVVGMPRTRSGEVVGVVKSGGCSHVMIEGTERPAQALLACVGAPH
jgi:hypothetical protein